MPRQMLSGRVSFHSNPQGSRVAGNADGRQPLRKKCGRLRIFKYRSTEFFQKRSHSRSIHWILDVVMTKRKPGTFSATKAVKANARERVGQPKPVRVVNTEPRTGRQAKHKTKLEEIIRQGE